MTHYKFGEIVLLEFPFTDSQAIKKRPALIITDTNDDDVICARITTQIYTSTFDVQLLNFKESNLLAESVIRCHKIATLSKSIINRKLGSLSNQDIDRVKAVIIDLFS